MRVLVIGGTGFIGPAVVTGLVAGGHVVTIYNRGHSDTDLPESVDRITGDRLELPAMRPAIAEFDPDVVIDMYAMNRDDAVATRDAVRNIAPRLVTISSMDVYRAYGRLIGTETGPPELVPLTEDSPLRQRRYPYRGEGPRPTDDPQARLDDYEKLDVEEVVFGEPDPVGTVLRLPMVYGPRDSQHRLGPWIAAMDAETPTISLGHGQARWRSTWGFVTNVADAVVAAAIDGRAAGQVYNIAEEATPTTLEIVEELATRLGWSGEVVEEPEQDDLDLDFQQDLAASSARIREHLGITDHVERTTALDATIAWEREVREA